MKPRSKLGVQTLYVAAAVLLLALGIVALRMSLSSPARVAAASLAATSATPVATTAVPASSQRPWPTSSAETGPTQPAAADGAIDEATDPRFTEEPDPYPQNEVEVSAEAEEGLVHSVVSDIKTGADIEAEMSERTGGAYIADNPYAPPPDDLPEAADASGDADRETAPPAQ